MWSLWKDNSSAATSAMTSDNPVKQNVLRELILKSGPVMEERFYLFFDQIVSLFNFWHETLLFRRSTKLLTGVSILDAHSILQYSASLMEMMVSMNRTMADKCSGMFVVITSFLYHIVTIPSLA